MATIIEDYVSSETAKLLKEKGFVMASPDWYYVNGEWKHHNSVDFIHNAIENIIPACTQQMAMKWLREVHNLCLFIIPATIDETFRAGYALYPQCDSKWEWCASKNDRSKATFGLNINRKYCDSYEEAVEKAIKYCLEHLI